MRKCLLGAFLLVTAFAFAQTDRTIQVELNYTGSGTVDASHKVYVVLWDTADLTAGPPVAVKGTDSKTGTVTFSGVEKVPAYATVAYDPTGKWEAQSPPPAGSSLGMYSKNPPTPDPIDVQPGKTAKVKLSFDDSFKRP